MDRYEMEQMLTEIAAEIDSRARAVESGNKPYITFMSQYAAPEGWIGKGKWSQRFYPVGNDRADITDQFKNWLAKFEKSNV